MTTILPNVLTWIESEPHDSWLSPREKIQLIRFTMSTKILFLRCVVHIKVRRDLETADFHSLSKTMMTPMVCDSEVLSTCSINRNTEHPKHLLLAVTAWVIYSSIINLFIQCINAVGVTLDAWKYNPIHQRSTLDLVIHSIF